MRRFALVPLLLALPLAACDGGGLIAGNRNHGEDPDIIDIVAPDDRGAATTAAYAPLSTDDTWLYTLSSGDVTIPSAGDEERLLRVTGTVTVDGLDAAQMDTRSPDDYRLLDRHLLRTTATTLSERFIASVGPAGLTVPGLPLLSLPLMSGSALTVFDQEGLDAGSDLDSDGVNERVDRIRTVTVAGPDSIIVPAGTFANALKVTTLTVSRLHYSGGGSSELTERVDEWRSDGIGMVRRLVTTSYASPWASPASNQESWNLMRYAISYGRSELQSPQPDTTALLPASGSTVTSDTVTVRVPFQETIDVSVLAGNAMILIDALGEAVPGQLSADGHSLTFRPDAPLPDGSYSVRVTHVKDVIGNELGFFQYSFSVDAP